MRGTTRRGLALAALILGGWLVSLLALLAVDLAALSPLALGAVLVMGVLARTLLQTGLFIVGHDAMHRVLVAEQRPWNDRLGALALMLYAALPYQACRRNHRRHHRFTASSVDPDFHAEPAASALAWYVRFMAGYLTPTQMGRLLGGWALLALAAGWLHGGAWIGAWTNVLLFCTLPLLLSSLQLFVFGTYLPHRGQRQPQRQPHPASLDLPEWLSLLACFHFGYHREHHDQPQLPWFELPRQRRPGLAPA